MQFTITAVIAIITAATAVLAVPNEARAIFKRDNCDPRYVYCGHTLMKKGRYARQILEALEVAGQSHGEFEDAFFGCIGGPEGEIEFIKYCGDRKCIDGGTRRNDYCL